jgi:hypothetical protein
MLLFLVAVSFASAQYCKPFAVQAPNGQVFNYDLSSFATNNPALFLTGTEAGATWTAETNICGLVPDCPIPSSVCQNDGSGNYFSLGSANSTTFSPYYNPSQPGTIIPSGGVLLTYRNGDLCKTLGEIDFVLGFCLITSEDIFRKSFFFLQCNPNVFGRPLTYSISESDPVTHHPTPCVYYATIAHASFCPLGGASRGLGSVYSTSFVVAASTGSSAVVTTSPTPFLNLGLTCTKFTTGCTSSYPTFSCVGPLTAGSISGSVSFLVLWIWFCFDE